ncbi:MAG TPA: 3'(2'),5'-bisphosphate nucleotidase [Candidatus Krumholzibacteria bacterium]|nr:3'(2'),5'-bisphosphate nucleotidase [Candidatus Krumholzibacteria bacterium]
MTNPWSIHPLARDVEAAVAAVREAGLLCREVQAGIDPGAMQKKDKSPVTVADYGSQALVCRALAAAFPGDPVIGEEDSAELRDPANAALLDRVVAHVRERAAGASAADVCAWIDRGNAQQHSARFWTLDPIDGTKGFLRGEQYAVGLALIVDGVIAVSALACPNLGPALDGPRGDGTIVVAVRGLGAWQRPMAVDGPARPVHVSPEGAPSRIRFCESVEAAHSSHDDAARIAAHLAITAEPRRLDSMTKYAVVARGEAEAYLRLPRSGDYREKIWDHAAGVLAVLEAGGQVTDVRGRRLDFGKGYRLEDNLGVIVSNGAVHAAVLAAIDDLGVAAFD